MMLRRGWILVWLAAAPAAWCADPATGTATATPSPTVSPTFSPTEVVTATESPTTSPTPWIVYGTATAVPITGDASIPGNLFHPGAGQPLQLRFDAPLDATISIDLYNRIGQRVRHLERDVSAGRHMEPWDGRDGDGQPVPAGIYVAQFKGKGLFKAVKFAVIK